MCTHANTLASEDPLPQRLEKNSADLTQRAFASVLHNISSALSNFFRNSFILENQSVCRKFLSPINCIPSNQRFFLLSVSQIDYLRLSMLKSRFSLSFKHQSVILSINTFISKIRGDI